MNIVYLGTPDFSVKPLIKLLQSNKHNVVAVVTNPDRPVGRKQIITACPVKEEALKHDLKVLQYDKIRITGIKDLKELNPDIMITCAFGQILSQEILDIPKYGVINIHASLLPKYRGASPIHHAILNGENETGITIMKTDIGIDTGDIIIQKSILISNEQTCGDVFNQLSDLGADLIVEALDLIESGRATYIKQDEKIASTTTMIKKEHAKINWEDSAVKIYNQIRAFNPAPIAYTFFNGQPLRIYQAQISNGKGCPGEILVANDQLEIACGNGSLLIKILQKSGGKAMEIKDFLRGNHLEKGKIIQ